MEKRVHGQLHRREVPSIDEVKVMKVQHLKLELDTILKSDASGKYTALAKEILISNPPVPVVAALLKQVFHSTERESYGEIEKTTSGQRDDRRERRPGRRDERRSDRKWRGPQRRRR